MLVCAAGTLAVSHEDVQALVAFLGDCPDAAVVEDVAQALAAMLMPSSFVHRQLTAVCQVRSVGQQHHQLHPASLSLTQE